MTTAEEKLVQEKLRHAGSIYERIEIQKEAFRARFYDHWLRTWGN